MIVASPLVIVIGVLNCVASSVNLAMPAFVLVSIYYVV